MTRHRKPKLWLKHVRTAFYYLMAAVGMALVILAAVLFFGVMGWGNPA